MPFSYDKEAFVKLCQKYELSLVILHGSYARGIYTHKSDIDIAFLGEPKIINDKYFKLLGDFLDIFGDKFDPVVLNGAEAMITYQVALNGIALYERQNGLFNSFKTAAIAKYMDTKKFRVLEKRYIQSAIEKG